MKKYLLIAFVVLLAVAAGSTWFAFQNPSFVTGLVAVAANALWAAIMPVILKRMTPEQEAAMRKADSRGQSWDPWKKKPKDWGH